MSYVYVLFPLTIFLMSLSTSTKGTLYLDANLLPIYGLIKPKRTQSNVNLVHDSADLVSQPSCWIQFGNYIEGFWNGVITDSKNAVNLIEQSNMRTVNGKERQIDHHFSLRLDEDEEEEVWYLECKNNLAFDSQKTKAANLGILELVKALLAQKSGYFCPTIATVPDNLYKKYKNKGITVYGVNDILEVIDAPFTSDEYFAYFKQCKPLWRGLLGVETPDKVSQRRLKCSLDLL